MFSRRLHWDLTPNRISQALAARRVAGGAVLDLTVSNPTRAGFVYDDAVLAALSQPAAMTYEPSAQGLLPARQAVAEYYADHGAAVEPADIFLTASTSEAYAYVFKLLTDPGDEVLVPRPSYPLFDFLATLEHVDTHAYPAWTENIEPWRAVKTRALVAVHPNNPTGDAVSAKLAASCAEQNLPWIVDEVFLDYPWPGQALQSFAGYQGHASFVLSGLSKVCGLPQMKLGWIVVGGPAEVRRAIRERLDLIADTYLSASAAVQWAAVDWLRNRHGIQAQIRARVGANLATLDASGLARRPGAGGWTAVVELPDGCDEEEFVLSVMNETGVLVQPGYFYDFDSAPVFVVSLLAPCAVFEQGVRALSGAVSAFRSPPAESPRAR